jgi:hypothetical protein
MSKPNDGGQAFPSSDRYDGMTLRDFFAAAVAAGLHANPHLNSAASAEDMAFACYQLADAMITKRNEEVTK